MKKYWGCEMESKLYWQVVNEMKTNRERLIRHANGIQTLDDFKTKKGKKS